MPRLSSFYGIVITMYYREHGVPHFHVRYGEYKASISIDRVEVLGGFLPIQALRLVRRWVALHRLELLENWNRAQRREALESIDPLP
ncbi:MAG TPA: DUF4160 domain-containing protein [Solirubrobacterales bacterium]|nr:DUF4160 domain-containing protein [Solirubrobacterales bacterium]